jgi:hypothetical protein
VLPLSLARNLGSQQTGIDLVVHRLILQLRLLKATSRSLIGFGIIELVHPLWTPGNIVIVKLYTKDDENKVVFIKDYQVEVFSCN